MKLKLWTHPLVHSCNKILFRFDMGIIGIIDHQIQWKHGVTLMLRVLRNPHNLPGLIIFTLLLPSLQTPKEIADRKKKEMVRTHHTYPLSFLFILPPFNWIIANAGIPSIFFYPSSSQIRPWVSLSLSVCVCVHSLWLRFFLFSSRPMRMVDSAMRRSTHILTPDPNPKPHKSPGPYLQRRIYFVLSTSFESFLNHVRMI